MKLFGAQRTRETPKLLQCLEFMKPTSTVVETQGSDQFTGPKKGRFPENDAVFTSFFKRHKAGINCIAFFFWHIQQLYHFSKIQLLTANVIHI
jgi:hypothetical protein